jgi:hypothetical protein
VEHGTGLAGITAIVSRVDDTTARTFAKVLVLHRDFPTWAVWLPASGEWTAVRPASGRRPAPGLPMIWASGDTSAELAVRMRAMDEQLEGS